MVSRAPPSIPDSTIASRASTDWWRDWATYLVLPPVSSSVSVSSATWPGAPSNSNVWTIRCGATTSWYTPRNPYTLSSSLWVNRHRPPGRTSIWSTTVSSRRGPHHLGTRSGSVIALNTTSRGASKTRVMTMSCRPGSITNSVSLMVCSSLDVVDVLDVLDAPDFLVEPVKPVARDIPIALDPVRSDPEGCDLQAAGPPLRVTAAGDQPGPLEHLEMFGDRLEADGERFSQLVHRGLAVGEARQDGPPRRVGQGGEREAQLICRHPYSTNQLNNQQVEYGWIVQRLSRDLSISAPAVRVGVSRRHSAGEVEGESDAKDHRVHVGDP